MQLNLQMDMPAIQAIVNGPAAAATLKLLSEVAAEGGDLPRTRGELFDKAAPLLLQEENRAHIRTGPAMLPVDVLLDTAGSIFAHLILAGMSGISRGARDGAVDGFVSDVEILRLDGQGIEEVMHTRLFRDEGESLIVPVHRLVAEFLAGRWLAIHRTAGFAGEHH